MSRLDYLGISFVIAAAVFCSIGISKIKTNTEDVLQWLPDQSNARTDYDVFEAKFGSDDFLIVTWEACTIDDSRLSSLAKKIRDLDSEALISVVATGGEIAERLHEELDLTHQDIEERLRGVFFGMENSNQTCVFIELSPAGTARRTDSMNLVWEAIESTNGLSQDSVTLAGYPYVATFIDGQLKNSYRYFLFPSVFLATLVSLSCLRNLALTSIVFVTALGAAASSVAFIPICGAKMGGLMSIIPALVFVLATSGSIHLVRYSLTVIGDVKKLIGIGWKPCLISTATTAVGMLSLTRSDFPAIRNFGFYCATGVGFALVFQLVLVPWLLKRFGQTGLLKLASRVEKESFWLKLMKLIRGNRLAISVACFGLMLLGAVGLTKLKAQVEVEKLFRANSQILKSLGALEAQLGPTDQTEVLLVFDSVGREDFPRRVKYVQRLQNELLKLPEITVAHSLINYLPNEPKVSNARSFAKRSTYRNALRKVRADIANGHLLSIESGQSRNEASAQRANTEAESAHDIETWRVSLRFPFTEAVDFGQLAEDVASVSKQVETEMDSEAEQLSGDTFPKPKLLYTGKTHLFHHAQATLLQDLFQNFLLAFIIITPMLILVLRSVQLGLIAMLPNLFPSLIVFGGLGWFGFSIDLAIAMTASVALGIAVDDTTHFLIRFRDFDGSLTNTRQPILRTISQCGPAMLHTTLIGGSGLIVYYFSDMLVVSRFSWAICILLVIALLADVIMLPAILFLCGESDESVPKSATDESP